MCRFVAYIGEGLRLEDLLYRPSNGLIHQAASAMESPTRINADGFGVAWYRPEVSAEPALFKDLTPAWNNPNLRRLAGKVLAPCILAHVRHARDGSAVAHVNCQPFQRGNLLWMHNGVIPGRGRLHRRVVCEVHDDLVESIEGTTDSELSFTLFLSILRDAEVSRGATDGLADAVRRTLERILAWWREDGADAYLAMNFCVSDGRRIIASRFARGGHAPSLHFCTGSRYVCEDGSCRIEPPGPGSRCVLVTSEALSEDSQWRTVPEDSLVIVSEDRLPRVVPLDLG